MIISNYTSNAASNSQIWFDSIRYRIKDNNKKVGLIDWWWTSAEQAQLENLKKFVESQDICFFVSEEIFDRHHSIDMNKVFKMLNSHNVYYIVFSHDLTLTIQPSYNRTFYNPWFVKSPLYIPSTFKPDLDYVEKPYAFNLMLGSKKPFRTLTYKILKDNKNIYSKYLGHPIFKHDTVASLDDDEIKTDLISQNVMYRKLNTMNFVEREGQKYAISHVVPENIYANTHFDIVTETFVKQHNMFLTEKTAKPLATGRFFCWYNSNNVINHLEKYGFDFTNYPAYYDIIYNDVDRLEDFLQLIENISSNSKLIKKIYESSKHTRIHNMNVYKEHMKNFNNSVSEWIVQCLNS